ncbi:MAG TPA: site-2 protease family protein, partial [Candidatus Binataceae bacterium]|nr:site-2 protease family protein [Candidatus Binataceae bacterium]
MITSIVAAVLIFAILIIVHEAGHFFVAKRLGVRVLRFSIGYPPRLFGIRRGETDYALGATPLGGYVRMLGDEIADEPSPETITGYLEELKLDLLQAAQATGWLERSGKSGDDALVAIANEFAGQVAIANEFAGQTAVARQPAGATTLVPIIGREPKPDEV